MKSLRNIVIGFSVAALAGATSPVHAQTQPAPAADSQGQGTRIVVNPTLVVVPVTVKDHEGRLVADLQKSDFRIFEDSVEQRIEQFTVEAYPLSIVILIDNDLKTRDARQVQDSLDSIVAGLSTADEAFVCRFDQRFHEGKGFTKDQDKLLTELQRTELDASNPRVGPSGGPFTGGPQINGHDVNGAPSVAPTTVMLAGQATKAIDDAIYEAAQVLKDRGDNRRKMIFVISDGVNNPKFNTQKYDTVMQRLQQNNILVYGVGVGKTFLDFDKNRVAQYAKETGGDIYYGNSARTLEQLYSRVTEEARNQYTLAYSPHGTDRNQTKHSIEVRVERGDVEILTRDSYYSGAPGSIR
jgi:VWFA-related protein